MDLKYLQGIWYNDNYKMVVENNTVALNTNHDTVHKPFYTSNILHEPINWKENDKKNDISEHIIIINDRGTHNVIVLAINIAGSIQMIRLIKFTE
jgi:hypothetical protein